MKKLLWLFLVLLVSAPAVSWGATYYVDPDTGDDANAGTLCSAPIDGYAKAGFLAALAADDVVLQKAGTTYVGQLAPATSGTSGHPIIFGVYVSCASPARVTDGSSRATINANNATSPAISIVATRQDITIDGLNATGGTTAGQSCHLRVTQATRITIRYSTSSNGTGNADTGFCTDRGTDNIFEYLSASSMAKNGFLIYCPNGTDTRMILRNSTFSNNNASNGSFAGLNISCDTATANIVGATIDTLTLNNNRASGFFGYGIRSIALIQHSTLSNITASGQRQGIYMDNFGTTQGEGDDFRGTILKDSDLSNNLEVGAHLVSMDNMIVRNVTANYIGSDSSTDFGRGITFVGVATDHGVNNVIEQSTANYNYNYIADGTEGVGLSCDNYSDNCTIRSSTATGNEGSGIQVYICDTCYVYGNLVYGNGVNYRGGGGVPTYLKAEMAMGLGSSTVNVYNNTFVCTGTQSIYGVSEPATSTITNVNVFNNVVQGCSTSALSVLDTRVWDYNDYWNNGANVLDADGGGALSDGANDLGVDPLFLSTTDFRLQVSSTLRRAGRSGYLCADARGRACYPDRPDIGAYQATSGDPAATRTAR